MSLHIEVLSFEESEWNRGRLKTEWQVKKLEHIRQILLFEFNRGEKEAKAVRNMGDNAIGERTARKLFSRFKENRFDISDTPRSGNLSGLMRIV